MEFNAIRVYSTVWTVEHPVDVAINEMLTRIKSAIGSYRFQYTNEKTLQEGIARVFSAENISFLREVDLEKGTIDFVVDRIGVEIKIKGSPSQVARQAIDYLESPKLDALVLVTGRALAARYLGNMKVSGKLVHVVYLWNNFA